MASPKPTHRDLVATGKGEHAESQVLTGTLQTLENLLEDLQAQQASLNSQLAEMEPEIQELHPSKDLTAHNTSVDDQIAELRAHMQKLHLMEDTKAQKTSIDDRVSKTQVDLEHSKQQLVKALKEEKAQLYAKVTEKMKPKPVVTNHSASSTKSEDKAKTTSRSILHKSVLSKSVRQTPTHSESGAVDTRKTTQKVEHGTPGVVNPQPSNLIRENPDQIKHGKPEAPVPETANQAPKKTEATKSMKVKHDDAAEPKAAAKLTIVLTITCRNATVAEKEATSAENAKKQSVSGAVEGVTQR
ncbi:MAG: hypothetical protein M1828_005646 [Chrysothrix sp. TS-e1954]|nr:MAG: hypothetical protein M1828_005646 [Chrysothrix sp. TS-e1954]